MKKQPVKIVFAGDGAVGKTTLCKMINDSPKEEVLDTSMTLGVEIHALDLTEDEYACLWDLGGQERFRFCQDAYVAGVKIIVLMYSVDRLKSINGLENWLSLIPNPEDENLKIFLVANKIDTNKTIVHKEDLQPIIDKYKMEYFELSARTGIGVAEFRRRLQEVSKTMVEVFTLKKKKKKEEVAAFIPPSTD